MIANVAKVRSALKSLNGRLFSVTFVKTDGSHRKMVCRLGVTKFLSNDGSVTVTQDDMIIRVFEMPSKTNPSGGYRSFRIDRIVSLKLNGMTYAFEPVMPVPSVMFDDTANTALIQFDDIEWMCRVVKKTGEVKIPVAALRVIGDEMRETIVARLTA